MSSGSLHEQVPIGLSELALHFEIKRRSDAYAAGQLLGNRADVFTEALEAAQPIEISTDAIVETEPSHLLGLYVGNKDLWKLEASRTMQSIYELEASSEVIPALMEAMQEAIPEYAQALVDHYIVLPESDPKGYISLLSSLGYDEARILLALGVARDLFENATPAELRSDSVTSAADMHNYDWPAAREIISLDEARSLTEELTVIPIEGIGDRAFVARTVEIIEKKATLRCVAFVDPTDQITEIRERMRYYWVREMFKQGRVVSAVDQAGKGQIFVDVMTGFNIGEVLFGATILQDAYPKIVGVDVFLGFVEDPWSWAGSVIRILTENPKFREELVATDLDPVPNMFMALGGPRIIVAVVDALDAALIRSLVDEDGVQDPETVLETVASWSYERATGINT